MILLIIIAILCNIKHIVMGGGENEPYEDMHSGIHNIALTQILERGVDEMQMKKDNKTGGGIDIKEIGNIHWTSYKSWEDLWKNDKALQQYFHDREKVLNNPNLNWDEVMKVMHPKLHENKEYIGILNVDIDGKTVRIEAMEASSVEAGTSDSLTTFAYIPSDLVEKYMKRVAMFMFHTHPSDIRANPMFSSSDLSVNLLLSATSRFAGSVLISRYGVFINLLDKEGFDAVNNASDKDLALLNITHDIVAAHESIRSWCYHTMQDYIDFYERYRMILICYPSSEMIGETVGYKVKVIQNIESYIDHDIIDDHSISIEKHMIKRKKNRKKSHESKRVSFAIQ